MSGLLLDASAILAAFDAADAHHTAAHELIFGGPYDVTSIDLVRYELANVTTVSWSEPERTTTLLAVAEALSGNDGLIRSDMAILNAASDLAAEHTLTVYDATYVVAARSSGRALVSCDQRDLISKQLALPPAAALDI